MAQIQQEVTAQVASQSEAYRHNLQRYEQEFTRAIQVEFPVSQPVCEGLDKFQADLGLTDEDVTRIKQPIIERRTAEHQEQQLAKQRQQDAENRRQQQEAERLQAEQQREQEYQQQLKRYEQEFSRAIRSSFPVDNNVREGLKNFQQALNLKDEDIARLEAPLLKAREAEYQKQQAEKLRQQQEVERLQQQEAERLREQQRRQQKEESERQQAELRHQQEAGRLKEQKATQQNNLDSRQLQEIAEQQNQSKESLQGKKKFSNKRLILLGVFGIAFVGASGLFWLDKTEYVSCICQSPAGCKGNSYDPYGHTVRGETVIWGYHPNSLDSYDKLATRKTFAERKKAGFVCDVDLSN